MLRAEKYLNVAVTKRDINWATNCTLFKLLKTKIYMAELRCGDDTATVLHLTTSPKNQGDLPVTLVRN
jgi:hypothetical protein